MSSKRPGCSAGSQSSSNIPKRERVEDLIVRIAKLDEMDAELVID